MSQPRRIGIIGSWGHLPLVLHDLDRTPDRWQVVGVAPGVAGETFASLAAEFTCLRQAPSFDTPGRLLAQAHPEVVVVSTRLDRIAALTAEAARAGCHVLCEKPLAQDPADLHALYANVARAGVQCSAIMNNRAHPVLAAACLAIARGVIGRVVLVNARKSYRFGTRPAWFGQREFYGGTIPWIGIHALDFIHAAAGVPFTRVAALQTNSAHPTHPDCQDNCVLALALAGGAQATASIDYLRPAAAPSHGDDWVRIVGTQGVIEAHMEAGVCTLSTESQGPKALTLPPAADYFSDLLARLPAPGAAPNLEMRRSFMLTHAALCARDAAAQQRLCTIDPGPWDAAS
jgi:predicted dehydrogenase